MSMNRPDESPAAVTHPPEPEALMAPIKLTCALVGLSKTTIYRMVEAGDFPKPVLVGRRALWPVSRLQEWRRQLVVANPDKRFDRAA